MEKQSKSQVVAFNPRYSAFRANPYPTYEQLRMHDPIHYRSSQGDWILTRYTDIVAVLKDARFGHSERILPESSAEQNSHPLIRLRLESQKLMRLWLLLRNPPAHTRLRKLFHHFFAPRTIKTWRSRIELMTNQLIDQVQTRGSMDIIHELAYPLPVRVICEILGIPEEEQYLFRKLAHDLGLAVDIDITAITNERGILAIIGFAQYFRRLIAKRRTNPPFQDSLLTTLIQKQTEGLLSEDELLAHCILIFFAGHATTQHLIGNGILTLLRHPDQLRLLQAQPSLIKSAMNECLRYSSPAQLISRTALSDVVRSGKTIRKGQKVHLILGAANRDPAQFPEPNKFDIRRRFDSRHLAFGVGIHYCFGAHLAQLIAEIAISTLVHRLPDLALPPSQADSLEWEESFQVRGLKALPVVF